MDNNSGNMTSEGKIPAGPKLENIRCPLCDSDNHRNVNKSEDYLLTREEFVVVQCLDCGLFFTNPRVKEENISQYYFSDYSPYKDVKEPQYFLGVKKWIARRFGNIHLEILDTLQFSGARTVLEIGPGSGSLLIFLKQHGFKVVGVEIDRDCVNRIRKENITCYHGRLENVYEQLKNFDAVIMCHILEHIYHPQETLKTISNILSENGVVYISIPNIGSVEARLFGRHWRGLELPRHVIHYDRKTISALLSQNGFKIVRIKNQIFPSSIIESIGHKFFKNGRMSNSFYYPLYYFWKILAPLHLKIIGSGVIGVTARKNNES
ncbi:class I SAM-dependent methyltransferase [Thermodesulfobacteriota bacterium]